MISMKVDPIAADLDETAVTSLPTGGCNEGACLHVSEAERSVAFHIGEHQNLSAVTVLADTGSADHGVRGEKGQIRGVQQNRTGRFTGRRVDVDFARVHQSAGRVDQSDRAVLAAHDLGRLSTGSHAQGRSDRFAQHARREEHRPFGDLTAQRKMNQVPTVQIQRSLLAGSQDDLTGMGHDGAFIDHRRTRKHGIPTGADRDLSLIDHGRQLGPRDLSESVIAGKEIFVRKIESAGHQTADVHYRLGPEKNAVAIDEKDVAVGLKSAKNNRWIDTGHAIQNHGEIAWLQELDRLATPDGEGVPVHDRLVRQLLNLSLHSRRDVDLTVTDRGPGGISRRGCGQTGGGEYPQQKAFGLA